MGGRLTVVGTGIMFPSQMTFESADAIRDADEVFFNVGAHPLAVKWLKEKAKKSVDLYDMYADGKDRSKSYAEMVEAIVSSVKQGNTAEGRKRDGAQRVYKLTRAMNIVATKALLGAIRA